MFRKLNRVWVVTIFVAVAGEAAAQTHKATTPIDVELRSGGRISGFLVAEGPEGVVLIHDDTPFALSWLEMDSAAAYRTKWFLMRVERGRDLFHAEDYFAMGQFALRIGRRDLAANEFAKAAELDPSMRLLARGATYKHNSLENALEKQTHPFNLLPVSGDEDAPAEVPEAEDLESVTADVTGKLARPASDEGRVKLLEAYKKFGAKVSSHLQGELYLLETDHFLIWTDWHAKHHGLLSLWAERMYEALREQFRLPENAQIFLAKCPMFVFRSKVRFTKFARDFDDNDVSDALGYTRSIAENGHVHMALFRTGSTAADFDLFAWTLTHEGTHAFLHRLYDTKLIPHWINEGLAEYVSEKVLDKRVPAKENADLLAVQYVTYDWPIDTLLRSAGPIDVEYYPIAHSVIESLAKRGDEPFSEFIRDLKKGASVQEALAARFDGLTLQQLEANWRKEVKASIPAPPADDGSSRLPWLKGGK